MAALFASGRIVDLILAAVAGEALLLVLLSRRLGVRPALRGLIANLTAGTALMLALRAALTGAAWPAVGGWMLAGLAAHLVDLGLRLRGATGGALGRRLGRVVTGTTPAAPAFTRDIDLKQL